MKRLTALILALLMAALILPATVSAEEIPDAPIVIQPTTTSIEGNLLYEEDKKIQYQVTLPQTGQFIVSVLGYCDGQIKIYNQLDPSKNLYNLRYYGDNLLPKSEKIFALLPAGTYIVEATTVSFGEIGRYLLSTQYTPYATNEIEPNYYDVAMPLAEKKTVNGSFTVGDEFDFYVIKVASKSNVEFTLKSYINCSAIIYSKDLYKQYGSIYNYGSETQPATNKRSVELAKGTYYVKVDSSSEGYYSFSFKTKPVTPKFKNAKFNNKKKQAKLNWSKVQGAKGYEVFRSKKSSTKGFKKLKTVKKNTLTTAMAPLYKKYYFKVRAYKMVKGKKVYSDYCPVFYIYTYRKY